MLQSSKTKARELSVPQAVHCVSEAIDEFTESLTHSVPKVKTAAFRVYAVPLESSVASPLLVLHDGSLHIVNCLRSEGV